MKLVTVAMCGCIFRLTPERAKLARKLNDEWMERERKRQPQHPKNRKGGL